MTVLNVLKTIPAFVIQLVVLVVLLAVKLVRIAEERRRGVDLDPRRPTVFAAVFLVVGLVLGLAGQFPGIYGFTVDNHPVQYVQNLSIAAGYFSLQFLYLPPRSVRPGPRRRETMLFVIYAVVLAVLSGLMEYLDLPNGDSAGQLHQSAVVAVFYLVATSYFVYIAGAVALRGATYVGRTAGWTRVGLALTAVAGAMQSLGSVSRLVTITSAVLTSGYPQLLYRLASPLFNLSKPILVLGLVLPLLAGQAASVRRRLERQRLHRQMRTLANVSTLIFPEIARRTTPGEGARVAADAETASGPGDARGRFKFRYIRRITECRDALNKAIGYRDSATSTALGPQDDSAPQRFWKELVACGFEAEDAVRSFDDLDEEAKFYARLSRRMGKGGIAWVSTGPEAAVPEVQAADQV